MPRLTDSSLALLKRLASLFAMLIAWLGVCLCTLHAQTGGAARLIAMSGQVSVMRGNAAWALNMGDLIQPQQVVITGPDGNATFRVADGSTMQLFPNSQAIFRKTAGDWRDLIDMILGRVRVEIEKLGGQPNPNKVVTPTAVISVRGTIFDVEVEDSEGTTLVLVEEGLVDVQHQLKPGKAKRLSPGEWIEVFPNSPIASSKTDHSVILEQAVRSAKDTLYQILLRSRTSGGGGAATSTPAPADTNGKTPPPPPPPPPPPH